VLFWILALYIIVLLIIWGFFIVARMHTLKFKNFSTHILPVTNYLMILLIILSLSWFIFIFYLNLGNSNYELSTNENTKISTSDKKDNWWINYQEEIIWDEFY